MSKHSSQSTIPRVHNREGTLDYTNHVHEQVTTKLLKRLAVLRGVSNAAKLRTRLRNLYNFTQDYTRFALGLHTGIYNSRIGCNILVFRVIIGLKVQLG